MGRGMATTHHCGAPATDYKEHDPDGNANGGPSIEDAPVKGKNRPLDKDEAEGVCDFGDEEAQSPGARRVWRCSPYMFAEAIVHHCR